MFREMRRKKQQLSVQRCGEVLRRGTSGVLALSGDGGYPYAVPLSYVYDNGAIYFHCAGEGHKLDAIHREPKASFCVVDQDRVVPETYTTHFRSVIAFGTVTVLEGAARQAALEKLAVKYAPMDAPENRAATIAREGGRACLLMLTVEHMTGKEAIELAAAGNAKCEM